MSALIFQCSKNEGHYPTQEWGEFQGHTREDFRNHQLATSEDFNRFNAEHDLPPKHVFTTTAPSDDHNDVPYAITGGVRDGPTLMDQVYTPDDSESTSKTISPHSGILK